ncbi:MAG: DNA excision repair protein ERCC-2 [Candidatus Pseudothioglobus sp.]|jgi:DNA excision repair protein ERCC-2
MGVVLTSQFKVSVRELVEQVERSGDINFRFSSRSSALAGLRGHQRVQKARGAAYVAEKKLSTRIERDGLCLEISGRVDGYFPTASPMLVEEIKTTRGDPSMIPDSVRCLHWAQARVYAHLLAKDHGLADDEVITLRLCYLELADDAEFLLSDHWSVAALKDYFDGLIETYLGFLAGLHAWRHQRDRSIEQLDFPYGEYRAGQRDMAVSVYRTMIDGGQLILQAPTGIGKTMAALFPAIKVMPAVAYDKLFFVSAKNSGQQMARDAINDLKQHGLVLRDITLTAKSKICFTPGAPCAAEHCRYAKGYYDKLAGVRRDVLAAKGSLERSDIEALAHKHEMCPFELGLDLSLIADVIVCDYNYVFDPGVYLRRYFDNPTQRYGLLMDEAHNLVDRGRDMFSAEICKDEFLTLRRQCGSDLPAIRRALGAVNAQFLTLIKPVKNRFEQDGFYICEILPDKLMSTLRRLCLVVEDWLQSDQPSSEYTELLQSYFDWLRFLRISESFDRHYRCLLIQRPQGVGLKLYSINPGPNLAVAMARLTSVVGFSATLMPQRYFQTLMGIGEKASWFQIDSPFAAANLGVFATSYISTTYRDRADSLYELVDSIAVIVAQRFGNYLVFLPSFAYLNEVRDKLIERHPGVTHVSQTPGMDEVARSNFLGRFKGGVDGEEPTTLVGFAVMGGIFGEGIDLKGSRLIGVIIAGVGLPQIGVERDLIKTYFEQPEQAGQGFEFAYQYPAMSRVLQTAGRVIRGEQDRGIICLIDNRFNEARYRRLMPPHWQVQAARNREILARSVAEFWRKTALTNPVSNDVKTYVRSPDDSGLLE